VPAHRWADGTICREAGTGDFVVDVRTMSIDDATANWPRVDFVKIDAEGSEEKIWAGMRRTVRRNPGLTVVMEFKQASYEDPGGLLARIRADGFVLRHIEESGELREISAVEALQPPRGGDRMLFLNRH
jgi:hypothetical protein